MNLKGFARSLRTIPKLMKEAIPREPGKVEAERRAQAQLLNPSSEYTEWLKSFHATLSPDLYLEIGVSKGATLSLAESGTTVIGVDPAFRVSYSLPGPAHLYRMTSDDFFSLPQLRDALTSHKVNMGFIDGLHEYRQVLRDVYNLSAIADRNAVILVHDVLPPDAESGSATRSTVLWAGDVYKTLAHLSTRTPDVYIRIIRTAPTALAVIGRTAAIRSACPTLADFLKGANNYDDLTVEEFTQTWLPRFPNTLDTLPSEQAVRDIISEI
jgi:hypothetical protein